MTALDLYGPPPTKAQLAEARNLLETQESSAASLQDKISDAQRTLERLIAESQSAINELEEQNQKVQKEIAVTLAYISPLRRLPNDILREVFYHVFEVKPSCGWGLAVVCTSWRRLVLNMPTLWSQIRLTTSLSSSPDTIRLWLERSGNKLPLDIEIRLIVPPTGNKRGNPHVPPPAAWTPGSPWGIQAPGSPIHDLYAPPPPLDMVAVDEDPGFDNFPHVPMAWHPPPPPPLHPIAVSVGGSSSRQSREKNKNQVSRTTAAQWGHVAMFYLTEQMHRWRRFVLRYDRQFHSVGAFGAIAGEAPLLEEFEVSCAEGTYNNTDCIPLANHPKSSSSPDIPAVTYPNLRTLTLQLIPFRWSAAALSGGLRSLTLRSLSSNSINVDRLLYIIDCNRHQLSHLSLTFQSVQQAVLPLSSTTLPELKTMILSGSYLLPSLVDALTTPALESLGLEFEPREPVEEAIASLLTRSGGPPLSRLTLAYTGASAFYAGVGVPGAWAFLAGAPGVKALSVGQTTFETVVGALARPTGAPGALNDDDDDDGPGPVPVGGGPMGGGGGNAGNDVGVIAADIEPGTWLIPALERLTLRGCHPNSDPDAAVQRLIKLVEERNPLQTGNGNGGVEPHLARLNTLEVHDCISLGEDVLKWLKARVPEVKYTEPSYSRRVPRSPSYFM